MLDNILFSIFLVIMYWQGCCMFSTYSPKCLSSRLYITVSNQHLYNIFSGGFRGMQKVAVEDRNKITVIGIMTYILLLPWVIVGIHFIWNLPADSAGRFWVYYFGAVMFIDILDDVIGQVIYFIKGGK